VNQNEKNVIGDDRSGGDCAQCLDCKKRFW
jgi:hypothetical protein